jgi:hypothetical protein
MVEMFLLAGCFALALLLEAESPSASQDSEVIAIDVLIEPDAAMVQLAKAVNARLRQEEPAGFALDTDHVPHLTLLQRYIKRSDLAAAAIAVNEVVQSGPAPPLRLTATGYEAIEWAERRVLLYRVERSAQLLQLARRVAEALRPFSRPGGTAEAFARSDGEEINAGTIESVEQFVPAASGVRYSPHITLGSAGPEFVGSVAAEEFEPMVFTGVNVAIYQLGNFGTAQRRLWAWQR